jgi:hypothetical protein
MSVNKPFPAPWSHGLNTVLLVRLTTKQEVSGAIPGISTILKVD